MFSIEDILELAIQIEENGEKLLREAQRRTSDSELNSIFGWLGDEEIAHAKSFSSLKPARHPGIDTSGLETMGQDLLRDMLGEETFSLDDVDLSEIENVTELIQRMIEFENDTVLFYEMIRSVVSDPATTRIIDEIISQEKQHARTLQTFLDNSRGLNRSG